ncbi:LysE family translocator [uncultured Litoreibacter sp.]|uniref:LysE family translocator n=1 Tax=uncultured Litoreibacter sp. TaxID=1392394 RepID=UPI0026146C79|nr:LysE family translocator [uncultured Litoreibacter sp.]
MSFTALFAIWLLHLFAAISPGPSVLMSARIGVMQGMRAGTFVSIGIGISAVIWAAAALFGLAIIFEAAPALLWSLKILGGIYLVWLGWKMWKSADTPLEQAQDGALPRSDWSALRLGMITQLANPKPAIMFSAIFLGTVPPSAPVWVYVVILTLVFLNDTLWNVFVARLFSFDRSRRAYLGLKSHLDRCFGGLLALLGVKIAAT